MASNTATVAESSPSQAPSHPMVLLVQRDQESGGQTCRRLAQDGFETAVVNSGREAEKWLQTSAADLIVIQFPLADMSLENLVSQLKERHVTIPFIVVASGGNAPANGDGATGESQAVRVMKLGARDYLFPGPDLAARLSIAVRELWPQLDREREQAAAQRALQERGEQFRLALAAAGLVTWESNFLTNKVTYTSDDMLKVFGATRREDLKSSEDFLALIHPDDREMVLKEVDHTIESGADYDVDFRVIWPDGSIRWVHARGQVKYDEHGRPVELLGVSQDITDRKRTTEALREIVQGTAAVTGVDFFQSLVKHLAAALQVRWAGVSEIIGEGDRARVLAYWDTDHFAPNFEYVLQGSACEHVSRDGISHFASGVQQACPDFVLYRDLGVESYLGLALRDSSGAMLGFMAVLHDKAMPRSAAADATLRVFAARAGAELERKRAEEIARRRLGELAHVTRLGTMGEMISELAHEINQPLYAIGNFAEACVSLLRSTAPNAREEALPWMQQIVEQVRRVGGIVRRLGRYVRKAPMRRSRVDLNELVEDVVQFLEMDERWKTVRLTIELEDGVSPVLVDRVQIEQVLVNLLLNALDAMSDTEPHRRALSVKTSNSGSDWVTLTVRDTGRGVANEKNIDKLFEPFFTTKPEGMGMGLAISRSLVQEHGGRLWATPNSDYGLTLQFNLPTHWHEDDDNDN